MDDNAVFQLVRDELNDDQIELQFLEGVLRRLPDHINTLKALGDLYTWMGEISKGLSIDQLLVERCSDDGDVWYNLACSYALSNLPNQAFSALNSAIDRGYKNAERLLEDRDLSSLREDERFADLMLRVKANHV